MAPPIDIDWRPFFIVIKENLQAFPEILHDEILSLINNSDKLRLWNLIQPVVRHRRLDWLLARSPAFRDTLADFYVRNNPGYHPAMEFLLHDVASGSSPHLPGRPTSSSSLSGSSELALSTVRSSPMTATARKSLASHNYQPSGAETIGPTIVGMPPPAEDSGPPPLPTYDPDYPDSYWEEVLGLSELFDPESDDDLHELNTMDENHFKTLVEATASSVGLTERLKRLRARRSERRRAKPGGWKPHPRLDEWLDKYRGAKERKRRENARNPPPKPWKAKMKFIDGKWRARHPPVLDHKPEGPVADIDYPLHIDGPFDEPKPAPEEPVVNQSILLGITKGRERDDQPSHDDPDWLANWLVHNDMAQPGDLALYDYKGWRIHGPKIQLMRVKNFLADEDLDRAFLWKPQFEEITEYLVWLLNNDHPAGKSWEYDFKEACNMLHCHTIYEKYHYGTTPLFVNFDTRPFGEKSRRLALPPDTSIVEVKAARPLIDTPRYQLHRLPESYHDNEYGIPDRTVLNRYFLGPLRHDESALARYDPAEELPKRWISREIPSQLPNGFNMAEVEDTMYASCMRGGRSATAQALQETVNFRWQDGWTDQLETFVGVGQAATATALLEFASFRGAKRAALQQVLASVTHPVVVSPHRKLIVPTYKNKKLRKTQAQEDLGVIWQPLIFDRIPDGEETFPFTYWYHEYLRGNITWAKEARRLVRQAQRRAARKAAEDDDTKLIVAFPPNHRGPFRLGYEEQTVMKRIALVKKLNRARRLIEFRAMRHPRPFITQVRVAINQGYALADHDPTCFQFLQSDWLHDEQGERDGLRELSDDEFAWLQLLTQPSANGLLLQPLHPHTVELVTFADRVKRLLDDRRADSLFGRAENKIPLPDFVRELNRGADGPVKKLVLTESRAEELCRLLAAQGRIGFEGPTTMGGPAHVTCPHYDLHPEYRVRTQGLEFPVRRRPQPGELRSWEEVVAFRANIENTFAHTQPFFLRLAYRLGVTIIRLQNQLAKDRARYFEDANRRVQLRRVFMAAQLSLEHDEVRKQLWASAQAASEPVPAWRPEDILLRAQPFAYNDMIGQSVALSSLWYKARPAEEAHFRDLAARGEEPTMPVWSHEMSCRAAAKVRAEIIRESVHNANLLYEGRPHRFASPDGTILSDMIRDPLWDWARVGAKPRAKRFFDVTRWPVHLQDAKRQRELREGMQEDGPPGSEFQNPTVRQQLAGKRPYDNTTLDDREEILIGQIGYPWGDTKLQQRYIADRTAKEYSERYDPKKSWISEKFDKITSSIPLVHSSTPPTPPGFVELPEVEPHLTPVSRPVEDSDNMLMTDAGDEQIVYLEKRRPLKIPPQRRFGRNRGPEPEENPVWKKVPI